MPLLVEEPGLGIGRKLVDDAKIDPEDPCEIGGGKRSLLRHAGPFRSKRRGTHYPLAAGRMQGIPAQRRPA